MKICMKSGETRDVSASYGLRQIEQGNAIAVCDPPSRKATSARKLKEAPREADAANEGESDGA